MGFTFTQPLPRRPGGVRAVGSLDHDALVPGGDQPAEELLGGARVVGEQPRHHEVRREVDQGVVPHPGRLVDEVDAVAVQHVEQERS